MEFKILNRKRLKKLPEKFSYSLKKSTLKDTHKKNKLKAQKLYSSPWKVKNDPVIHTIFKIISSTKIECQSCKKSITKQIKVLMGSEFFKDFNKENNFEIICLKCFFIRIKNYYKYYNKNKNIKKLFFRIIPNFKNNLFVDDWTFNDELKLFGGFSKFGLENWEELSKFLNKGQFECMAHYYNFYYKDKLEYLKSKKELFIDNKNEKDILKSNKDLINDYLNKIKDLVGYIPFLDSINKNFIQYNRSLINKYKTQDEKNKQLLKNASENLGYWPKRKEYEVEYFNDAELELSELEFERSITELDKNYKRIMFYNNVLYERREKKQFIIDKEMFEIKKQINYEKKLCKENKEIYNNIKNSMSVIPKKEFNLFFENLIFEKNLKLRLNLLKYYKAMGLNTYQKINSFLLSKKKEINKKEPSFYYIPIEDKITLRSATIKKNELSINK